MSAIAHVLKTIRQKDKVYHYIWHIEIKFIIIFDISCRKLILTGIVNFFTMKLFSSFVVFKACGYCKCPVEL